MEFEGQSQTSGGGSNKKGDRFPITRTPKARGILSHLDKMLTDLHETVAAGLGPRLNLMDIKILNRKPH